jgi:hypothetical protein
MARILLTGAAGDIGTRLRKILKPVYPELRLSDIKEPADLGADEEFVPAELARIEDVERAVDGVDGVIHLGGFSVEGPWEAILQSNIIGCYNLFEAARRKGVKRIVFASSNHAVGFYPRHHHIGVNAAVRPDSRYGVSKAFGEALGALYADKHGLRVLCLRIGNVGEVPIDKRRLASGAGGTTIGPTITATVPRGTPRTTASAPWPSRPSSSPTRSATSSKAAASAAWSSRAMGVWCGRRELRPCAQRRSLLTSAGRAAGRALLQAAGAG